MTNETLAANRKILVTPTLRRLRIQGDLQGTVSAVNNHLFEHRIRRGVARTDLSANEKMPLVWSDV